MKKTTNRVWRKRINRLRMEYANAIAGLYEGRVDRNRDPGMIADEFRSTLRLALPDPPRKPKGKR